MWVVDPSLVSLYYVVSLNYNGLDVLIYFYRYKYNFCLLFISL